MEQLKFISLFLKQVAERANSIAIATEQTSITYEQLYQKARLVQMHLNEVADDHPFIGIDCNAGIDSYAYIIGVWMYGGAYVPINTSYPASHLAEVKAQTGLKIVLNKETCFDDQQRFSGDQFIQQKIRQAYAYVIFTSGTTGKPKGVPISTTNLNAFFAHYIAPKKYQLNVKDIFLQSYELSFDVSIFCFGLPLMIGARLVLPKQKGIKYLNIAAAIIREKVTVCSNVPSVAMHLYSRLNEVNFTSLRYCFFSGEALHGNWAKAWMKAAKNAQVYNCYGPTETTIVCTSEHLNSLPMSYFESQEPLPLGQVFEGTKMELKNDELYFAGQQVFNGYLNQENSDQLLFPTGDLGYRDENKRLIFKGRKDQQVQVNGYRIELQSIDNCIQQQLDLRSVTFAVKNAENVTMICTILEMDSLDELAVKEALIKHLPAYSQPLYLTAAAEFPMNQNGKLDKQRLRKLVTSQLTAFKSNVQN